MTRRTVIRTHALSCNDARAKIEIAAEQYPFRFKAVQAEAKKRGGGWKVELF